MTKKTLKVEIRLPQVSDSQVSHDLRQLTEKLMSLGNETTGGLLGGEFGYGAEIGISTDRLHARGPMGLRELCSYKFVIEGAGQVRG